MSKDSIFFKRLLIWNQNKLRPKLKISAKKLGLCFFLYYICITINSQNQKP